MDIWQTTAWSARESLDSLVKIAGSACRVDALQPLGLGCLVSRWSGSGWCGRCREPVPQTGEPDSLFEIRVPAPTVPEQMVSDTPGRLPGKRRLSRYGWSWPEPPAGATPHQRPEPPSPGRDRGLRAAGVTNGRRHVKNNRHAAAQRKLFGRLLGCLHHCLATGQHYDETTAFPAKAAPPAAA